MRKKCKLLKFTEKTYHSNDVFWKSSQSFHKVIEESSFFTVGKHENVLPLNYILKKNALIFQASTELWSIDQNFFSKNGLSKILKLQTENSQRQNNYEQWSLWQNVAQFPCLIEGSVSEQYGNDGITWKGLI